MAIPMSPLSLIFRPKVVRNKRLGYLLMDLGQGRNVTSILGRFSTERRDGATSLVNLFV